jgi:hypothetical protein
MNVVKVISRSGDNRAEVITDEGTTKHIRREGPFSDWKYLHSKKFDEAGQLRSIYKTINWKKGGRNGL